MRRLVAALVLAAATGRALLRRRTVCAGPREIDQQVIAVQKRTMQIHTLRAAAVAVPLVALSIEPLIFPPHIECPLARPPRTRSPSPLSSPAPRCASGGDQKKKAVPEKLPEPIHVDARDSVGEVFGVSGTSVDYAKGVLNKGIPELIAACDNELNGCRSEIAHLRTQKNVWRRNELGTVVVGATGRGLVKSWPAKGAPRALFMRPGGGPSR